MRLPHAGPRCSKCTWPGAPPYVCRLHSGPRRKLLGKARPNEIENAYRCCEERGVAKHMQPAYSNVSIPALAPLAPPKIMCKTRKTSSRHCQLGIENRTNAGSLQPIPLISLAPLHAKALPLFCLAQGGSAPAKCAPSYGKPREPLLPCRDPTLSQAFLGGGHLFLGSDRLPTWIQQASWDRSDQITSGPISD